MSEQKRYTAQEMKNAAKELSELRPVDRMRIAAILRQAADAEEELVQLKARLEAVVMECATPITDVLDTEHDWQELSRFRDMVLRAARGEGGAE